MSTSPLTPHQEEAFKNIIADIDTIIRTGSQWDNVVSLTGPAGVGKTFLTSYIIKTLSDQKKKVQLTTPTHKSLKVARDMLKSYDIDIDSSTIHSFLNLKLKPNTDKGIQELIKESFNQNSTRVDVLIVDESSMVSEELYDHIKDAIRYRRAKCVLFIGDGYQLPPVEGGDNPVFSLKSYALNEIVRQAKDNPIISLATDIRERIERKDFIDFKTLVAPYVSDTIQVISDGREFITDYYSDKEGHNWSDYDQIVGAYTNDTVDKYNNAIRNRYWKERGVEQPAFLMVNDELVFQEAHIIENEVIHANNDMVKVTYCEKTLDTNSKLWYWECRDEDDVEFKILDPDSQLQFQQYLNTLSHLANTSKTGYEKKTYWQQYFELKGTFQVVKYRFASTVHKLQGSTYKTSYIDMREMNKFLQFQNPEFIYRLAYVAVTRASNNIKIFI